MGVILQLIGIALLVGFGIAMGGWLERDRQAVAKLFQRKDDE